MGVGLDSSWEDGNWFGSKLNRLELIWVGNNLGANWSDGNWLRIETEHVPFKGA